MGRQGSGIGKIRGKESFFSTPDACEPKAESMRSCTNFYGDSIICIRTDTLASAPVLSRLHSESRWNNVVHKQLREANWENNNSNMVSPYGEKNFNYFYDYDINKFMHINLT